MNKVKIVADSGCDLNKDILSKLDIELLYLRVVLNDKEYKDSLDITSKQLYSNMMSGTVYTTSQCPYIEYKETFEKYAKENTPMIYIGFSSGISGTFNTSLLALSEIKEEYPNWVCACIDSKCASVGYAAIVIDIAKKSLEGISFEKLLKRGEYLSSIAKTYIFVEDLTYLVRGGRLSKTAGNVASALNIRPLISFDEEGKLYVKDKIRGDKKVLKIAGSLYDEFAGSLEKDMPLCFANAQNEQRAMALEESLLSKTPNIDTIKAEIGCAIGAHIGPGTYAFVFFAK